MLKEALSPIRERSSGNQERQYRAVVKSTDLEVQILVLSLKSCMALLRWYHISKSVSSSVNKEQFQYLSMMVLLHFPLLIDSSPFSAQLSGPERWSSTHAAVSTCVWLMQGSCRRMESERKERSVHLCLSPSPEGVMWASFFISDNNFCYTAPLQ